MNNPTPKLSSLYYGDFNIKSAISMIGGSILFQFVTYLGFEMFYPPIVMILLGLTVIGIIWLIYRYNLIMTTFREGITVRARVLDTETMVSRNENGSRRRSYYAKIAYNVGNESFETRMRLPGEPIFYGIEEGGDVDLVLREEKPKTFFIKSIYLK
jgi:hypothetical protein